MERNHKFILLLVVVTVLAVILGALFINALVNLPPEPPRDTRKSVTLTDKFSDRNAFNETEYCITVEIHEWPFTELTYRTNTTQSWIYDIWSTNSIGDEVKI